MRKLELCSIITKYSITNITRHHNVQDDPYCSSPVLSMRLKVCDKNATTSVADNCSLLLRHIHPVYSSSTMPRNQILFRTSRIIEARGGGEDNGPAEEF